MKNLYITLAGITLISTLLAVQHLSNLITPIVSTAGLIWSICLWDKANRPIISVRMEPQCKEDEKSLSLVVMNGGNRPARNVRLSITKEELSRKSTNIVLDKALPKHLRLILEKPMIHTLAPSQEERAYFGYVLLPGRTAPSDEIALWRPDQDIEIKVEYEDLTNPKKFYEDIILVRNYSLSDMSGLKVTFHERQLEPIEFEVHKDFREKQPIP